jgi:hypothetical protein
VHPNKRTSLLSLTFTLMLASAGCYKEETPKAKNVAVEPTVSTHNRVKFKGGKRFVADMAVALSLDPKQVCLELGTYDCEQTHRVPLGGIDSYQGGIHQPLPERSVASTDAIDRIALSACEERAKRDFADPAAAQVFREIASGDVSNASKQVTANRLYTRLLRREPTAVETEAILAFYTELEGTEGGKASRGFATYACYAVATLEESVFF